MADATKSIMTVRNLTKRFGGVLAVDDVSFDIPPGGVVGVIGPNGAGKSTLLSMLSGSVKPTSGLVEFGGERLSGVGAHRACHRGVVRTHQIPRPFGELTVRRNLEIGSRFGGSERADIDDVLEVCGLSRRADVEAGALPHVELRRLELARALATTPRLLLLDEVGAGLTDLEIDDLAALVLRLRDRGLTVVVVEHIMRFVMHVSDHVVVMETGAKLAEGTPDQVAADPDVIEAYLGVQ